ncbi:hypothetical protein Q3G72_028525 [Acer saccharum]|nr:hypothetical protein Q3G72_028525 [Acer saccharum]
MNSVMQYITRHGSLGAIVALVRELPHQFNSFDNFLVSLLKKLISFLVDRSCKSGKWKTHAMDAGARKKKCSGAISSANIVYEGIRELLQLQAERSVQEPIFKAR